MTQNKRDRKKNESIEENFHYIIIHHTPSIRLGL
ncbi:MAG: hypothetical protein ACI90V_012997 [Bacillariaceae sp.]|jgi:hypothetical protein